MLRCTVVGVSLLGILSQRAVAQDTLSDAAWKADVARRAAARQQAQAARDSAALLVDTIQVIPSTLTLHVGDTLTFPQLIAQFKMVGKRRDGAVIAAFRPTVMIPPRGTAVVVRDGQVIAAAVGDGELWVKTARPTSSLDDAHPTTKVRLIVQ